MSLNSLNWWFELTPLTFAGSELGSLRAEGFAESMNRRAVRREPSQMAGSSSSSLAQPEEGQLKLPESISAPR